MGFDIETWQRTVYEALREIDPNRKFHVATLVLGFEDEAAGLDPNDFPVDELVDQVDAWLETLEPDVTRRAWLDALAAGDPRRTQLADDGEFRLHGTTIILRAHGRPDDQKGWRFPSLRELEEPIGPIVLDDGTERLLLDLTLEDVEDFAAGRLTRRGVTGRDGWCRRIAEQMQHFGLTKVSDAPPEIISVWAGSLGLVSAPPDLGPPQNL
jgi:hypothetical protein